jgi:hypothetical protein
VRWIGHLKLRFAFKRCLEPNCEVIESRSDRDTNAIGNLPVSFSSSMV